MASSHMAVQVVSCSIQRRPPLLENSNNFNKYEQPALLRESKQAPLRIDHVPKTIKTASTKMLDAFVDSVFKLADQPLPSQSNFSPVDELGEPVVITSIEGKIPDDFPEGVYIRNGPNPLFGGLKSTQSVFGRSSDIWVEGEGMLHALYFSKDSDCNWTLRYNNRHVETETFKLEKHRNKPSFFPVTQGDTSAVLAAYLLNMLRLGHLNKDNSNANVFEHSGKLYSISENFVPHEIDIFTLRTLGNWDACRNWDRSFTSHP